MRTSQFSGQLIANVEERAGIAEQRAAEATNSAVTIAGKVSSLQDFCRLETTRVGHPICCAQTSCGHWGEQTEAAIAELNSDRQRLDKSRADAVAAADEAKLALAAVNAVRQPRTLGARQQKAIANKMSAWTHITGATGVQEVAVFPTNWTFESANLANTIAAALGPKPGAGWNVNRYAVTFGMGPFVLEGVAILTSSNPRGQAVAAALVEALNSAGIVAFVLNEKRKGCEDFKMTEHPETEPYCSQVSVMVGDHP